MKIDKNATIATTTVDVLRPRDALRGIAQLLAQLPDGHPGKPSDALPWWVIDLHEKAQMAAAVMRGDITDPRANSLVLEELDEALVMFERHMPMRDGCVVERGRPAASIAAQKLTARAIRKHERAERKAEKKAAREATGTAGLPTGGPLPN